MKSVSRLPKMLARTGLTKSTAYREIKSGRFPKPIRISKRAVGWLDSQIDEWIEQAVRDAVRSNGDSQQL